MSAESSSPNDGRRGFFRRYGALFVGLAVVGMGVFMLGKLFNSPKAKPPAKPLEMVMIRPVTPPPPPPPTPPTPPEQRQQMMEQTPLNEEDAKPEEAPPDAAPAIGTNIVGNGPPDGFGLSRGGGGFLSGGGGGGNRASQFGWYAAKVVRSVSDALRQNSRTANGAFNIQVRIWADLAGRVTKVRLAESTGDKAVDTAIQETVLANFQLPEPPPDGMPMPIVMRLTARRPD